MCEKLVQDNSVSVRLGKQRSLMSIRLLKVRNQEFTSHLPLEKQINYVTCSSNVRFDAVTTDLRGNCQSQLMMALLFIQWVSL